MTALEGFIRRLPKAELHLHIEGTLEPEMMMRLAEKHGVALPYDTLEDIHKAYNFKDLQSFLNLYYMGASVLIDEDDFYQLMMAYLNRCHEEGIVHAEMMFDPQTHTDRGIDFSVFMSGFVKARDEAEKLGISTALIMCFLRHLPEDGAIATLKAAEPWRGDIRMVGLDSGEVGNPPEKFERVFRQAAAQGYGLTAHAGEEGPPPYIRGALDTLGVTRIDHGVRCLEDEALVKQLVQSQIPLTVCPLSNIRLRVFDQMQDHPILAMLESGLNVSVNSDDPPYFGGYLMDNFKSLESSLGMSAEQAKQLAANSIRNSAIDGERRETWLNEIHAAMP